MKKVTLPILLLCLPAWLFFSCQENDAVPDSLVEIMNRNGFVSTGGNSGTGGNGSGGAGFQFTGQYAAEVKMLLSKVSGWNATTPPKCSVGQCQSLSCIRDTYVCAAVTYAWAAEMEKRRGNGTAAQDHANQMHQQLLNAKNLCGTGPVGQSPCNNYCLTFTIFPC